MQVSQKQVQRLNFIDFMLLYCGSLNRTDLRDRFAIAPAAATRDLAVYKGLAGNNIVYDGGEKTYIATDSFSPIYQHDPIEALSYFVKKASSERHHVNCEASNAIHTIRNDVVAPITRAIAKKKALSVFYSSPFSDTKKREFVPHCLVDDGLRWHVRGFCRLRGQFIDLVVSRIRKIELLEKPVNRHQERAESDRQWNRYVNLEIVPHPNIPNKQSIEHEHQMRNGCMQIEIRAALAGYFLRRWNVDCSGEQGLEGREYHLWLKNRLALYDVDNLSIAPRYNAATTG